MPKIYTIFLLVLSSLLLSLPVSAQNALLKGQIKDATGAELPYATVKLSESIIGTSDELGNFQFSGLNAGEYQLEVSYLGFKTYKEPFKLGSDEKRTIDIILKTDELLMNTVVVTGSFNPQTKLESTVAITSLNATQIENRVPRGTADLLAAVPGFRVNSDGGEAANSIGSRGLPVGAESGFGYLSLEEDGLPLFEETNLIFAKTDIHFRVDETIDRVEVVRGGSAGIFSNNSPGGIINFISKNGGKQFGGVLKTTYGDQGLYRTDLNIGGPINEKWRYNIGGFYRYDRGVKYAGFPANVGGNIKANATYTLKRGYVRIFGKYLNDHVAYYTSIPYQNLANPEQIPGGPNFSSGTQYSTYQDNLSIPDPYNGGQGNYQRKLSSGQHSRYYSVGINFSYDLGNGFILSNSVKAMKADLTTDGIYDLNPPQKISKFTDTVVNSINREVAEKLYGSSPAAKPLIEAAVKNKMFTDSVKFFYADNGQEITDTANLNGNGLVNISGWFPSTKPVKNIMNKIQVSKEFGSHQISVGAYVSVLNVKEQLSLNLILQELANRPRLLNMTVKGKSLGKDVTVTQNGFLNYSIQNGFYNTNNNRYIFSYFAGDEWEVSDNLRLDAGFRLDQSISTGSAQQSKKIVNEGAGGDGGLDSNAYTLYDNDYYVGVDTFRTWKYKMTTYNTTIAGNYSISENLAVYSRYSYSQYQPTTDQYTFGLDSTRENYTNEGVVQKIYQAELGLKSSFDKFSFFITGFYSRNKDLPFTITRTTGNNQVEIETRLGSVESKGLEMEITYTPFAFLQLRYIGTIQDPRILEYEYAYKIDDNDSTETLVSFAGNRLDDTPQFLSDLGAYAFLSRKLSVFLNYRYFGERYANKRNTLLLPAYGILFAGASFEPIKNVRIAVAGSNILNTVGFGDAGARNAETLTKEEGQSTTAYNLIRPVLPRNITASVSYRF